MKRTSACTLAAVLLATSGLAVAEPLDCFPMCEAEAPPPPIRLCEHRAVRDIARMDRKLAPVKRLYDIAKNPTGFAIEQVSEHVVHIPKWVGIAMDPKGYVRGRAIDFVRQEAKKAVGLEKDCVEEIAAEDRG